VDIKNEAQVQVATSLGAASAMIIADGIITIQNNSISSGSGTQGSYLMYLSTNTGNPAMQVKNNAIADIVYASAGWVVVENNDSLKQASGYGVHLKNNAVITYEAELVNTSFFTEPQAAWELVSWKEVE